MSSKRGKGKINRDKKNTTLVPYLAQAFSGLKKNTTRTLRQAIMPASACTASINTLKAARYVAVYINMYFHLLQQVQRMYSRRATVGAVVAFT